MGIRNLFTKSFATRLVSSVVLVVVAVVTLTYGDWLLLGTLAALSVIGAFEFYRVFGVEKKAIGIWGYICVLLFYGLMYFGLQQYYLMVIVGALIGFMGLYVICFPTYRTEEIMAGVFGLIYAPVLLSFVYQVRTIEHGFYAVWLIFLCSWIADTFAYLVGITMGKHRMTPVLSPKKSVEGAIGGIAGSAVLGFLYACFVYNKTDWAIDPRVVFPIICGIGAVISMVGDLAASAVKRNHDIKDYGKLIPGHGGVLDRFDSVIMTAPCIWLLMVLFG